LEREWRNGVLVLISTRLGLKKVGTEYFLPVKYFFNQKLNCGIIGGRPKEAYYMVGMQEDSLIFLDPHNTLPNVPFD
jgi:cysteine protease ATG4